MRRAFSNEVLAELRKFGRLITKSFHVTLLQLLKEYDSVLAMDIGRLPYVYMRDRYEYKVFDYHARVAVGAYPSDPLGQPLVLRHLDLVGVPYSS